MKPRTALIVAGSIIAAVALAAATTAHAQLYTPYNDPRPAASSYDNPFDPNPGWTASVHNDTDAIMRSYSGMGNSGPYVPFGFYRND